LKSGFKSLEAEKEELEERLRREELKNKANNEAISGSRPDDVTLLGQALKERQEQIEELQEKLAEAAK